MLRYLKTIFLIVAYSITGFAQLADTSSCQTIIHGLGAIQQANDGKSCPAKIPPPREALVETPLGNLREHASEATPVIMNTTVDEKTAWDWAENRAQPVILISDCSASGNSSADADKLEHSLILSYDSAANTSYREALRSRLFAACSAHLQATEERKINANLNPEQVEALEKSIRLAAVPKEIFDRMPIPVDTAKLAKDPAVWLDDEDFSQINLSVDAKDREALAKALNNAGSCSDVAVTKNAKSQPTNCQTSGLENPGKKLAQFKKQKGWRIFGSTMLGALSGMIRGGLWKLPGTSLTRITAAGVFSMIGTAINGKDQKLKDTAVAGGRSFLGMIFYKDGNFIDGGNKQGAANAILVGGLEGAASFGITCGLRCAKNGSIVGLIYVIARDVADSSLKIAGAQYTRVAEAAVGATMGFSEASILAKKREKELETLQIKKAEHDAKAAHVITLTAADPILPACFH